MVEPALRRPHCFGDCNARGVRRAGAENVAIFPAPRGEAPWVEEVSNIISAGGTDVRAGSRLFPSRSARWGVSFALARWLLMNARRFDLVHAHGAWTFTSFTALLVAKATRRPAVLTTHESLTDFDISITGSLARR